MRRRRSVIRRRVMWHVYCSPLGAALTEMSVQQICMPARPWFSLHIDAEDA